MLVNAECDVSWPSPEAEEISLLSPIDDNHFTENTGMILMFSSLTFAFHTLFHPPFHRLPLQSFDQSKAAFVDHQMLLVTDSAPHQTARSLLAVCTMGCLLPLASLRSSIRHSIDCLSHPLTSPKPHWLTIGCLG
jgi:hypothetical protein